VDKVEIAGIVHECKVVEVLYSSKADNDPRLKSRFWLEPATALLWRMEEDTRPEDYGSGQTGGFSRIDFTFQEINGDIEMKLNEPLPSSALVN
jgi:hypothetical protein